MAFYLLIVPSFEIARILNTKPSIYGLSWYLRQVVLLLVLISYQYKHLTDLACPKNISSFWRFGSILGLCLATQIATGLFLAIYYASDVRLAFDSVIHIRRDVQRGWLIRSIHANRASFFFVCLYAHIGRGVYYRSFTMWKTWVRGVTLFLLTIVTAFMGYVLPWGQISYWAATVITNLVSTIPYVGTDVVVWLWGGFSVNNATLVRFYALHFLIPFVIAGLSLVHLLFLHETGSRNPLGVKRNDYIKFHPYFTYKDLTGFLLLWLVVGSVVFFYPNIFIDPENFIKANPLVTPTHIQPEWYFLPMYAILRSIPNKLGGVLGLLGSVLVLYTLPITKPKYRIKMFYSQIRFWWFCGVFIVLLWVGSQPVEFPFERLGQVFTVLYFLYFIRLFILRCKRSFKEALVL